MLGLGLAKPGDYVVVVAGSPPNAPGSTNTLRVHQLGSLVDPATVTDAVTAVARAGRRRPAARGARPQADRRGHLRGREPAGRRRSASSAARSPARRWSPPAAPSTRPASCTRCTATSCAPATRPCRSSSPWRTSATAAPSRYAAPPRSSTARRSSSCRRRSRSSRRASTTTRRRPTGVPGPDEVPTMADWVARYPDRAAIFDAAPQADRRALRRRARLGAAGRPGRRRRAAGLDAHRRQAAGRPAAARVRADLRVRPVPARLGAVRRTARCGGRAA